MNVNVNMLLPFLWLSFLSPPRHKDAILLATGMDFFRGAFGDAGFSRTVIRSTLAMPERTSLPDMVVNGAVVAGRVIERAERDRTSPVLLPRALSPLLLPILEKDSPRGARVTLANRSRCDREQINQKHKWNKNAN